VRPVSPRTAIALAGLLTGGLWAAYRRGRAESQEHAALRALRAQADRYETLMLALAEVGEGMVVIEHGRCIYANSAFEEISGYPFPELTAMESIFDLIVDEERAEALKRARIRAAEGVVDPTYQLTMRRRDGELARLEVAGVPLEVDDARQLVVVVRDVSGRVRAETARERALQRSALLAEASELFDQSLDEERTLRSVARLTVRDLADTCIILLGPTPGMARRVAAVARKPDNERRMEELQERYPVELRPDSHPIHRALLTGRPIVRDDGPGRFADAVAEDAGHRSLLGEVGINASIIVPLRARGRVHGVLAAGFERLPEDERDELLALFEDLARRAALALDNATLYAERSAVARTLQRSLLPPALPELPGMELAARYLPAGTGAEVGGDFYDCFATGGGDWAVVIGDVCGKGAEAAAITALARYTIRAAVLHSRRPGSVLAELNEVLVREGLDYRFCTVLYASLTLRDGGVAAVVATGGHPLPLVLRAGGTVETAGRPGSLLGVLEAPEISEEEVMLDPGDALVLFTDGVVDAGPEDGGPRFARFLGGLGGRDAESIATAVEAHVRETGTGALRDDVAVVVVRVAEDAAAPFALQEEGVAART
jgi:PAS domain S-box-containing protein